MLSMSIPCRVIPFGLVALFVAGLSFLSDRRVCADDAAVTESEQEHKWTALFDGESLKNWKVTEYGGEGPVEVKDGELRIAMGQPLSGITWDGGKIPRVNYEIRLQCKRVEGGDFFCGLTFPVQEDPCTLILGGWGGSLTGLSSLNGSDASENETTDFYQFEQNKWYDIRLRVTETKIQAWMKDDDKLVTLADVDYSQLHVGIRFEMELCKPLGLATYSTTSAVRDFKIRELTGEELAAAEDAGDDEN